ncbi:hypothetical protein CCACVL1_22652 [Corchorus capsularis]|uniref:Uncharacterized protein n=1 Tax=Corchorus capsularis TaxID=210143 RepID=A0A1R3GXN6_COCAP|nr:hypothetical protein CCACVL1_22652 [Corchorus capsularis]
MAYAVGMERCVDKTQTLLSANITNTMKFSDNKRSEEEIRRE